MCRALKFSDLYGQITDQFIEQAAKEALLSTDETKIWIEHLAKVVETQKGVLLRQWLLANSTGKFSKLNRSSQS